MTAQNAIDRRPSPIAGSWYPSQPKALRAMIEGFLAKAPKADFKGKVRGLIVPHAGYIYSGYTAACAFKALEGIRFTKVVVLAPSHTSYLEALLTSGHEAYTTPLGDLRIDVKALEEIKKALNVAGLSLAAVHNDREHSLEIQLPFLQVLLGESFSLVPMMMADQRRPIAEALAKALSQWRAGLPQGESVLFLASSDQSHFYSELVAEAMDRRVMDALKAQDLDLLYRLDAEGKGEACGLGPMAALLLTCRALGRVELTLCDHRNSAEVSGDRSSVVGYTSAVLSGE
ncbi:MAG: AmmeMemoRadiSam system protein B [Anaerolineaceae bacterium]|nr:AmmeMemoRadiSam system protein B [Anaerolineaceae bacterium]